MAARLRADLEAANTLPALRRFRDRLPTLRFFDPACGSGNFLVIAYRELRRLELEVLRRIRAREQSTGQLGMDVRWEAGVHVGQFYGIEIEEFPARIAETAIYLVDHLENLALFAEFGQYYARFPITDSAHVTIGNALRLVNIQPRWAVRVGWLDHRGDLGVSACRWGCDRLGAV